MTDQNDLMEELKRRHPRVHAAFVASEKNGFKFDVAEFFRHHDRLAVLKTNAAALREKAKRFSRVRVVASG